MAASNLALISGPAWTAGLSVFALAGLAWLMTYMLHSTLLLGSAWIATRRLATSRAGLRERVWKFAVLAAFATSSLQVGLGFEPLGGRLPLSRSSLLADSGAQAGALELAREESIPAQTDREPWPVLQVQEVLSKLQATPDSTAPAQPTDSARAAAPAALGASRAASDTHGEAARSNVAAALGPWLASVGGWTQWAFASCLLGAFAGLCLFAMLWVRLNGCLRDRVTLEHGNLAEKLRELCVRAKINRRVRLSVAPSLGAPISMGMLRPEICVPPRVLFELSEEEQEVLLAHELAHVVRRDPVWLALCRLCEGVFFFQPLNRLARREIEDCAEFLSDAWAVRQTGLRISLASCLTRIAEWIVGERRALPAPAMAQGRSRLRHRVELLLDESASKDIGRQPAWLSAVCLSFGVVLIAVVPCVSASEELLDVGDNGGLSFLPEHGAEMDAGTEQPACIDSPVREQESETGTKSCKKAPAEDVGLGDADDFAEFLKDQLDALGSEMSLLRSDAASLLRSHAATLSDADVREVSSKLDSFEMKLTRVRELSARIEVLRASLKQSAPATAPIVQPATHNSTPSTILEEIPK